MKCVTKCGRGASLAAFALLVFVAAGLAGRAKAQPVNSLPNGPIACGAAHRSGWGAWSILRPMTIRTANGRLFLKPGETFVPNEFLGRVEVSAILDRNCGNLPRTPEAARAAQSRFAAEATPIYGEGRSSSPMPTRGGPRYYSYTYHP